MGVAGIPHLIPLEHYWSENQLPGCIPEQVRPRVCRWMREAMRREGLRSCWNVRDAELYCYGFENGNPLRMRLFVIANPWEPERIGEPDCFEREMRSFAVGKNTSMTRVAFKSRCRTKNELSRREEERGRRNEEMLPDMLDFLEFQEQKRGMHKGWRKSVIVDKPSTA